MRIAIINACHPDRHHVCAYRGATFAELLSEAGHQVLIITPPLTEKGKGDEPVELVQKITKHDWSSYYHVIGGFNVDSLLPSVRSGNMASPFRQSVIAYNYLTKGNIYDDWLEASSALLPIIASEFKPNIVWAIFGNTSCWVMGQSLARLAGCPWVADIKDNWHAFLPLGFKNLTARRFSDANAYTVCSQAHADTFAGAPVTGFKTIYNGISPELMKQAETTTEAQNEILITGSLYSVDVLSGILKGIDSWDGRTSNLTVTYAGSDTEIFEAARKQVQSDLVIQNIGSLTPDDLWKRQRRAKLNVYVRNPPNLFHHKLLELLAAARPALACPGETNESISIAKQLNVPFFPCESETDIHQALDQSFREESVINPAPNILERYSSQFQAKALSDLLTETIEIFGQAS